MVNQNSQSLRDIIESLGYVLKDDGQYWRTRAIYRNGVNKTSVTIKKSDGSFRDFAGQVYGSFDDLIKITLGTDTNGVKEFYAGNNVNIADIIEHEKDEGRIKMEKIWDETELSNMLPHYKFYEQRGISANNLRVLKSGMAHSGSMNGRYVFPIYRKDGKIHGFTGRDITDKKSPKWKHIGSKTSWIYPVFVGVRDANNKIRYPVMEEIVKRKEIIIVESIGDLLKMWEAGVKNVIVSFGLDISSKLGCFLMSLNLSKIIIATNNDSVNGKTAGNDAAIKAYIELFKFIDFKKAVIHLPTRKDFGEMSVEEIESWQKNIPNELSQKQYIEILDKLRERYRAGQQSKDETNVSMAIRAYYDTKY